ncbi:hypothetical protein [Methylobacterium goesingense]|uniref:Uncharacterized protein n=1 Tax=Methylobacterium goesingense TaxID=243690 RepID=A0ABV2L9B7_9HYPH|nr:hypothetical protein [Methylobacterium goesingense]GJD72235.1 hypothetical protein CFIICLFH_0448 [Methylobacterium goesingense]
MRPTPLIALVAALLLPGWSAARAVEMPVPPPAGTAPGTPVPIQTFPLTRVVPKGEARAIAFFSYLYPDCASQGPVVARILEPPRHGTVTFAETDSFPRYAAGSPLAACSAKRVPGLRMTHEAEENFEGLDTYRILLINPDGTAAEYDVKVWVR